jgi:hypothetical protein
VNLPDCLEYQPVILIGAARSGTKIVRDTIALHPQIHKIPYDINYIWRLGNENYPDDELPPESLDKAKVDRLRGKISAYNSRKAPLLLEKTVSNCLRVPFVQTIFPEAKYIHLLRDGYDVIDSAYRQWQAPPDWNYIFHKALTFPHIDGFGYGLAYAKKTLRRIFSKNMDNIGSWGPRYRGIDQDIHKLDLIEICTRQWYYSVLKPTKALKDLPASHVLVLNYETFVTHPLESTERIASFLGLPPAPYKHIEYESIMTTKHIGKGLLHLEREQKAVIQPYIQGVQALSDDPSESQEGKSHR